MSSAAASVKRHALGLPAGSIRATHVLLVVGLVCAVLLIPARQVVPLPPYLIYLLFIMVGHYFAAHGVSISGPSSGGRPLHLPGGSIRLLVMLALGASIGWKFYSDPEGLKAQFDASMDELKTQPFLPVLILGGFFLGVIVRGVVGRDDPPRWFQDVEAWVSLLALVGLGAAVVIHSIINPSLETPMSMPHWEGVLGAVIAFYFGERS